MALLPLLFKNCPAYAVGSRTDFRGEMSLWIKRIAATSSSENRGGMDLILFRMPVYATEVFTRLAPCTTWDWQLENVGELAKR